MSELEMGRFKGLRRRLLNGHSILGACAYGTGWGPKECQREKAGLWGVVFFCMPQIVVDCRM